MPQIIREISRSVLWIAGTDFVGQMTDIKLPEITAEVDEESRLGLIGISPVPIGIKKMEATFTFNAWSEQWASPFSNIYAQVLCTFRGALASTENQDDVWAYVVDLGGYPMKIPMGGGASKKITEWAAGLHVNYCRQEVNGKETLLVNSKTNEYKSFGKDVTKATRAAMGLV